MRASVVACLTALSIAAASSQTVSDPAPLLIREIGSLHVGGRIAAISGLPVEEITFSAGAPPFRYDPNGSFMVEAMYAQYVRLANPRARYPLLLVHGGGLTGVTWETTPDGRPGWQMFFLRQGHDVFVSDAVERGRSGWARFPEVMQGTPAFRTMGEGWHLFRVGDASGWAMEEAQRRPHPNTRFPVAAWNQFARQSVPRWFTTDRAIQAAYDAYVQQVCPCVIIVHSQGGNFAFQAALAAPDKVRAIVAIEPSGAPNPASAEAARVRAIPHLVVWGDNFEGNILWERIRPTITRWQEAIRAAGGTAETLDLPARGIAGNSHMLMMDTNSDQVAALVQEWLAARGLMR